MKSKYVGSPLTMDPVHAGRFESLEFGLAFELIRAFGLVAGKPGPEDSQGRASLTLLSVEECVQRACDMSALFVTQAEERGWLGTVDVTPEQVAEYAGKLQSITQEAAYDDERRKADREDLKRLREMAEASAPKELSTA